QSSTVSWGSTSAEWLVWPWGIPIWVVAISQATRIGPSTTATMASSLSWPRGRWVSGVRSVVLIIGVPPGFGPRAGPDKQYQQRDRQGEPLHRVAGVLRRGHRQARPVQAQGGRAAGLQPRDPRQQGRAGVGGEGRQVDMANDLGPAGRGCAMQAEPRFGCRQYFHLQLQLALGRRDRRGLPPVPPGQPAAIDQQSLVAGAVVEDLQYLDTRQAITGAVVQQPGVAGIKPAGQQQGAPAGVRRGSQVSDGDGRLGTLRLDARLQLTLFSGPLQLPEAQTDQYRQQRQGENP